MAKTRTLHRLQFADARDSIGRKTMKPTGMLLTSPPYPMIEMWDDLFSRLNPQIKQSLKRGDGDSAFELMHGELDKVWAAAYRSLIDGSISCVNVGDATRTVDGTFQLYPNHSRVQLAMRKLGLQALPEIIWRKQSNKPNKFMGSGMLPAGAYVTQEHEYVLPFRKGEKRKFGEGRARRRSGYFWEERNAWFSDVWELKGDRQALKPGNPRGRSAAYPFELAYRLIAMFSVEGDWILDPFLGTGTTMLAAMALGRNSVGFEVEQDFRELVHSRVDGFAETANAYNRERLARHADFLANLGKKPRYANGSYGFPVVTSQETELEFPVIESIREKGKDTFEVTYAGRT